MQDMNLIATRAALFGAAFLLSLSPAITYAQSSDPMLPPTSSAQPGSPSALPTSANPAAQDSVGAPGLTGQMMQDKIFLRKAVEEGLAQVQLGQLASQKSPSDDVKALGQKMVTDHTTLNDGMKPIADSLGVMLPRKPSKDDQATFEKLSKLSGDDFDKEYLTVMVKNHFQDLRDFRQEVAGAVDPGLRDAAVSGQKVIREHTMLVIKIAKEKGIAVPERRPRPAPPTQ